ncbi:hypothetical protein HG530_015330 [Fusarium avenaceum]|nr:hypothetical protein HG530_015330 [Fusarium avenaceum]
MTTSGQRRDQEVSRAREDEKLGLPWVHERIVTASLPSLVAVLDSLTRALAPAPHDDGHMREAAVIQGGSCGGGDQLPLRVSEMNGLSVGALRSKTRDTGLSKSHSMSGNCGGVDVFCVRIEEAHGWDIDAPC